MKAQTRLYAFLLALVILYAGMRCATVAKGADDLLIRAEQTEKIGFGVVDTFVRLERRDATFRAAVGDSGHAVAHSLRTEFPDLLRKFREAQAVYKANRTAEHKASLETLLKLVEKALADAQFFLKKLGA